MSPYPEGSPEAVAWVRGAHDEAKAIREGMSDEGKKMFHSVKALAQTGSDPDDMVLFLVLVYTSGWSIRQRATLAWSLLRRRLKR
jgi:hypothetical protein